MRSPEAIRFLGILKMNDVVFRRMWSTRVGSVNSGCEANPMSASPIMVKRHANEATTHIPRICQITKWACQNLRAKSFLMQKTSVDGRVPKSWLVACLDIILYNCKYYFQLRLFSSGKSLRLCTRVRKKSKMIYLVHMARILVRNELVL